MEVVDRHGWVEGMTIKAYGRHVGFRADEPGVVEHFLDGMFPGWELSDEVYVRRLYSLRMGRQGRRAARKRYHVLYMNSWRFERSMDFDYIVRRLQDDTQLYIAERAVRRIFVHAGVVEYNGRAIVLPGRTMTGKTSLVAALLRLGATYYSDEYAVFSEAGRLYPFPKPLSVRTPDPDALPEMHTSDHFGAPTGTKPIRVGLVAFTGYRPGVVFRPRAVSDGRAVLSLLENTVPARRRPRLSFRTLEKVVAGAEVVSGARGEAEAAAETLLRRLG